jgi:ParB family transcriptional regulator, chromosome partitioning protein
MPHQQIDLADIHFGDRLRLGHSDKLPALAESMANIGLLQPIIVRPRKEGGYHLVAGRHRYMAANRLSWKKIDATIVDMDDDHAALAEIDENLIRVGLSAAEETAHLLKRKEIYERLHPETKHGAVGRRGKSAHSEHSSFVDDTAEKTGQAKSLAVNASTTRRSAAPETGGSTR